MKLLKVMVVMICGLCLFSANCFSETKKPNKVKENKSTKMTQPKNADKDCIYAQIIRDSLVISIYLERRYKLPKTPEEKVTDAKMVNLIGNLGELIYLFDCLDDEESLRVFANLSSYYIGEHNSEVYDCIALRKGKRLLPFLEEIAKNKCNECNEIFAKDLEVDTICREKSYQIGYIAGLIDRIKKAETCAELE
jgi:hypothetical protein